MSWHIGISSGACTESPILDMLPALRQSGALALEIGTPPRHFDPLQEPQIVALGHSLREAGLAAVSIHAPFGGLLDLAEPNPHHRLAAIGAILTAASAIKRLGGDLVVVHPSDLVRHGHDVHARLRDCADSLRILGENCREAKVTLVVESPLPHLIGGHPDEFGWLLTQLDDATKVCLDTGHTALGRHWHRFLEVSGSRLIHVHATDNHGHRDDHLPPGDGTIDWAEIARSLRAADFSGWIMLELRCPTGDPVGYFRRAFEQATRLLGVSSAAGAGAAAPGVPL
jgi:sugar phosphate isomerase/epimerase